MVASSSNGARGPSRFLGDAVLAREPFAAVLEFGEGRASSSWGLLGWSGMAAAFYAGSIVFVVLAGLWSLAPWTKHIQHYIRARLAESYEIDLIENKPVPLPEPEKVIEPAAHPTAEKPTPPPQAPASAPGSAARRRPPLPTK
ncbi:MAG: hypothetical protein WCI05_04495 [Myxococcales bacterium]